MVYISYPTKLTEEEEMLMKKYTKLRKKKQALQARRAPKPEPQPQVIEKNSVEGAADATAQAKKLLKAGAIKVGIDKKDHVFKRSKRHKESEKSSVGYQPFSSTQDSDQEGERSEPKSKIKGLYETFVSSRDADRERGERRPRREYTERRDELPKKGNTIYVSGLDLTEDILRRVGTNFGSIVNISSETSKNCGFITFEKMDAADAAIAEMNGSIVSGILIRVSMARRQPAFEHATDSSTTSWSTIAASKSQKGTGSSYTDTRELVTYTNDDDIF